MKKLPEEFKILLFLGKLLNEQTGTHLTAVEILWTELYTYVCQYRWLKLKFPSKQLFYKFLKQLHKKGTLQSFLNYRIDTSNPPLDQWYFSAGKVYGKSEILHDIFEATPISSKNSEPNQRSNEVKTIAPRQHLIYDKLKEYSHLEVRAKYPLQKNGETRYIDFRIRNQTNNLVFLWQHFGTTQNDVYKLTMTEKILWYRKNGFKLIKDGGNLIFTHETSETELQKEIVKNINLILEF